MLARVLRLARPDDAVWPRALLSRRRRDAERTFFQRAARMRVPAFCFDYTPCALLPATLFDIPFAATLVSFFLSCMRRADGSYVSSRHMPQAPPRAVLVRRRFDASGGKVLAFIWCSFFH